MSPRELLAVRILLALIWLYNGLYLKLIVIDPEHLQVVQQVGSLGPLTPERFLFLIGLGETALGLLILSGRFYRGVCFFQLALVVAMNTIGIASGGVTEPLALVFTNLPLVALIWAAARLGPGSW